MQTRYVVHLASGGLGHSLHYFGNSVAYALATGRRVIPCFEAYETFGVPFHDVFRVDESVICSREEAQAGLDAFGEEIGLPGKVQLANVSRLHGTRDESTPAVSGRPIHIRGLAYVPNVPRRRTRFVVSDGQLRFGMGTPGKVASAWFNVRVPAPTGLLRGMSVLSVAPEILQRTQELSRQFHGNYVGIHFRNTDRTSRLDDYIEQCKRMAECGRVTQIYWATDDISSLEIARMELAPSTVLSFARLPRVNGQGENVHCLPDARLADIGIDKRGRLCDALGDVYMLTRASHFLGHRDSALTRMVTHMRTDPALASSFLGLR